VTKLQTRLETNLLKRLGQLQAAAQQPEAAGQAAGLASLQADLARAESALADVEGRLAAVEARSDELSKEVCCVVGAFKGRHHECVSSKERHCQACNRGFANKGLGLACGLARRAHR
jgi:hypothetical protein